MMKKIKMYQMKIFSFDGNPFVRFIVLLPLLLDLLAKWLTFIYQYALVGDIYGLNALDASSNILHRANIK